MEPQIGSFCLQAADAGGDIVQVHTDEQVWYNREQPDSSGSNELTNALFSECRRLRTLGQGKVGVSVWPQWLASVAPPPWQTMAFTPESLLRLSKPPTSLAALESPDPWHCGQHPTSEDQRPKTSRMDSAPNLDTPACGSGQVIDILRTARSRALESGQSDSSSLLRYRDTGQSRTPRQRKSSTGKPGGPVPCDAAMEHNSNGARSRDAAVLVGEECQLPEPVVLLSAVAPILSSVGPPSMSDTLSESSSTNTGQVPRGFISSVDPGDTHAMESVSSAGPASVVQSSVAAGTRRLIQSSLRNKSYVTERSRSPDVPFDVKTGFGKQSCSQFAHDSVSLTLSNSAPLDWRDLRRQVTQELFCSPERTLPTPGTIVEHQQQINENGTGIRRFYPSSVTGNATVEAAHTLVSRPHMNGHCWKRARPSAGYGSLDTKTSSGVSMDEDYIRHARILARTRAAPVADSPDYEARLLNAERHDRSTEYQRLVSTQMRSVLQRQRCGESITPPAGFSNAPAPPPRPLRSFNSVPATQCVWRTGGLRRINWGPWRSHGYDPFPHEDVDVTEPLKSIPAFFHSSNSRQRQGSDHFVGHPNEHIASSGEFSKGGLPSNAVETSKHRSEKNLLPLAPFHPQCDITGYTAPRSPASGRPRSCSVQEATAVHRYQRANMHLRKQQRFDPPTSHAVAERPHQASQRESMSGKGIRPLRAAGVPNVYQSTRQSHQGVKTHRHPGPQNQVQGVQLLESETRKSSEAARTSTGEGLADKAKAQQRRCRTFILRSVLRRARALNPKATHLKVFLVNCGATSRVQGGADTGWSGPASTALEIGERIAASCISSSELAPGGSPAAYASEKPLTVEDLGSARSGQTQPWKDVYDQGNLKSWGEANHIESHTRRVPDLSFPDAFSFVPTLPSGVSTQPDSRRSQEDYSWVDHGAIENISTVSPSGCPMEAQERLVEVLSKEGQKQAIAAAKLLRPMRFTMIYCSDDTACQEMKNVILTVNRESPYVDDRRLGNRRKGALAHVSNAEFMRRAIKAGFSKETFRPPGGESLEDIRERAVFFFLEALVGEFLLSLNLKDFIATAAMDQRRAIARVSASERGRREEETGAAYKPESSLSCSLANAGHTAGTGGLSSSMPVFPAVSSQTNRYIPAGDEGCCELLRPSLAVRESAFTSTELGGGGGADALGHRIASCAVEPFSVREDQARGSRRMDQLRFQDRYSVVRNSRAYTPGSQCNSGSSTTLSPSVQLPVVAGDVGGAKTQFKWGSSRDSLAKSQPSDNSPPTGNCPSAAGCQLSKQREQSCTCCHRPTLDCRSIDRGGDEFAQQKNQETTVGDRQSLHDSKAWCDHQCEVANQVGGGCFGSSANQNGTGGDLGLTTRRCDAIGTLMGNSRPAWEGTCHSPRAPFITRPLTNDATPSPINAVLPQSVKGSQASDPSAKGSVGLAREDGGRCLSGDMSSSVSCSLHVMNDISMGHPGQQGVSFTSFCHSQPGDCGTAADKQVVVSLGTQSAQPGLESVVNSGTGKRQRRRRRRRKRTDVIGSPDGEDVNEDNGLRQAKDSRRTASAGCLPNSADAYVFSAECITRDVVHLGDGSPDGAEGPDDLEEFEFASVASCASMLYQHGLTTDDEHEYGCTHTKTKLSDRAHELEATNAEQAEIQAAQMDAVSEVTLTSEACFSTRVEQILKERQAAARRGTPSGLATAGTSDGTGNTASVNLSATAAVQSPKFNTEGIGKDETPTELGKGKWMCSVPEPCRRAGDAGYVGYTSEAVVGTLTALEDQGVTHLASGKVPVCSSSGGTTQESASLSLTTVKSSNEVSQMKCIGRSAVLSSNGEEDSVRSSHGYAKHGSGEMHTTSTLTDGQRTMFTQFLFFEEGHKIFSPRHVLPKMGGDRLQTRPTDRRSEIHARDTMPTKISQLGEHSVAVLKDLSAVTERPQRKSSEDGLGSQLDAQKSSCPPAVAQGGDVVAEAPLEAKGTWLDPKNMDISGELPTRDANAQPDDVNKNSSERFSRDPDNQSGAMEERRLSTDGSQGNIAVGRATVDDQSGHGNIVNAPKSTEPRMVGPRSRVLYDGENRNVYASQVDWCPKEESPRDITGTCDSKETPLRQRKGEPTVNVGIKKWEKEEQDASTLSGSLSWGKYAQCMQNESECLSTSTPTGDTPNGCALLPSYTSSNDDANHINKLTEEPLVCRSAVEGSQPMRGNTFEGGKKHGEGIAGSLLQTETGSGVYEGKPTCVRYPGSNNGSCAARSEPELNVLISGLRSDTQEMDPIIHMTDFCCDSVTSVKYGTDMCVKAVCDGRSRHFKEFLEDKDDGGRECQIRPEPQTSFVRDELATNQLATAEELSTSQKCVHGYLVTEPSLERRNELLHVASFEAKGRDGWVQSQRAHDDGRGAPRETPARGRPEQSGRIDYEEHSNSRFPLSMWQSAGAVEGVLPRIQSKCCVRRASSIPSLTASNKAIPGRQPAEGAKPWMEQKSLSKWHTFELRRARSFPDTRYYASRESGILALRMSTSSVCECAFERESLTSHDRQKRGSIRNPKHDGSDSGTEFAVRHQQPSSALRVSACGAMLPAEERKLRSATRRCRAALITDEARQRFDSLRQPQKSLPDGSSESGTRDRNMSRCDALKPRPGYNLQKATSRFVTDLFCSLAGALAECAAAGFLAPSPPFGHDGSSTGCDTSNNDTSSNYEESDGLSGTGSDGSGGPTPDDGTVATTRRYESPLTTIERQCVRTDTTKDDAGVELHANETKPWDNHRSGNGCGKNANDSTTTSEKKTGTLMAIRRFECRHWSDSLLGSLLERIGRSRQYNETGVEEASASSGTEEMAPESEHVANRLSEEAGVPCGKDKRGVATGMSSTRSSKDNFWSDGHAQVSPRGYRVLLMKRTVAQCVAASVASGLWLPPLSSLEAGFSAAGRQGRSLQADAASGTVSGSIEKERDGDSSRNGSVAVLVITHACVIRELLQALCGRRFGNTIKAGSITILDVYTRRTGNTELRRSVRRRRSEAWMWLTGRGSHAHQHMGDGRDQTTGTVENGLDHHASTCCSVHPSDFGRNDANMADDADWRLSGDPEMLSREQGQGEEAGDAGPHAQEAGEGDDVQIDTNNTSGATACASSSLVDDNCLSNSGHPESLTGTRVHVFKADVPSCSGERSRGNTENRPPGGLLNDIQCSGERTHCNVSHDENVQNRRPERDTASMSQQNQDESENGSFNHSKTVADATVCQCQIKNLVGSGSYGSRPHGTYLANHSLSGREESLAELSDIDEEEVDLDHGDLSLLAAPYRSKRLFASEQRTEALDALLSRVQCWVEVFNKKE